jgi:dolichyl-phosphate-mannose--protein O-mannosyl transferase
MSLPDPPQNPPQAVVPRSVWRLAAAMSTIALVSRGIRLGHPGVLVFDEVYYALNGFDIATRGVEQAGAVHPPLAKWFIAAGIRLFGFTPVGWRVAALLAGAVVVGATVVAAYVLTESRRLAALAGLVVLTDGISVITGRTALLDGFVAMCATVALAAMCVLVRHPLRVRTASSAAWVLALSSGAAIACKWSAAPLWLVGAAVAGWSADAARQSVSRRMVVALVVPILVYGAAFVPTMVNYRGSAVQRLACAVDRNCGADAADRLSAMVTYHAEVVDYHRSLRPRNDYAVSSTNWWLQTKPTVLYREGGERIVMRANPVMWVIGAAALVFGLALVVLRRSIAAGVVVVTALTWWLPWTVGSRPGYTFYASPMVPVLAVAVTLAVRAVPVPWRWLGAASVAMTGVIGAAMWWPRWTAW